MKRLWCPACVERNGVQFLTRLERSEEMNRIIAFSPVQLAMRYSYFPPLARGGGIRHITSTMMKRLNIDDRRIGP